MREISRLPGKGLPLGKQRLHYDRGRQHPDNNHDGGEDAGVIRPADHHAARAIALLRQAFAKGYTDVAHMQKDADLAPLRRRSDYAALLWDLADAPSGPPESDGP